MTPASLWSFALAFYAKPEVEAALLELQDAYGQSPPYLIWRLWLAQRGIAADPEALRVAAELTRAWEEAAVAPLRRLRRRLKSPIVPARGRRQERLRGGVKSLELEAERMLLQMLEEASPTTPIGGVADPATCLAEAARAWGQRAPAPLLERLAAAL